MRTTRMPRKNAYIDSWIMDETLLMWKPLLQLYRKKHSSPPRHMQIPTSGKTACILLSTLKVKGPLVVDLIIEIPKPSSVENSGSETAPVIAICESPIFASAMPVAMSSPLQGGSTWHGVAEAEQGEA